MEITRSRITYFVLLSAGYRDVVWRSHVHARRARETEVMERGARSPPQDSAQEKVRSSYVTGN